jgi:cytochrome o ubiquinol oxidase operon protein cyoD
MLNARHEKNTSFRLSIWGYFLSIALIFVAYSIATKTSLMRWSLILIVMSIAAIQTLVQLVTFLHLGLESKPKWALISTLCAFLIIFIIFGGTLWIMRNLNYNLMMMK